MYADHVEDGCSWYGDVDFTLSCTCLYGCCRILARGAKSLSAFARDASQSVREGCDGASCAAGVAIPCLILEEVGRLTGLVHLFEPLCSGKRVGRRLVQGCLWATVAGEGCLRVRRGFVGVAVEVGG